MGVAVTVAGRMATAEVSIAQPLSVVNNRSLHEDNDDDGDDGDGNDDDDDDDHHDKNKIDIAHV